MTRAVRRLTSKLDASVEATERRRARLAILRRRLPSVPLERSTPVLRAIRWLLPWAQYHYPGLRAGACTILQVKEGSLKHWLAGRRAMPEAVRVRLIEAIKGRLEQGHAVLAELEAMQCPPKRNPIENIQRGRAKRLEASKTL